MGMEMKKNYFFSIVIPTRNRVNTLKECLRTCLNQERYDNYEIVINDNSDGDETQRYIFSICEYNRVASDKLRYNKRANICSMSENFEDAIGRAKGDYIIVIGDDDGIMPMALFEINELANNTSAKIIKWSNGLYNWPDMEYQNSANYLGFSLMRSFRIADGKEELRKSINSMNYSNLPMMYINTVIHSDVINALKDGDGRMFRSRSPDVYSSIVMSYVCGKFIETTVPFTLAGLSRSSNGVSTAFVGGNKQPREDFSRLNARSGITLHPHVPALMLYPITDFAESFYFAKTYHFSLDDEFALPRRQVLRACVERADTSLDTVKQALFDACAGDQHLIDYVSALLAQKGSAPSKPAPRLKPVDLGADGQNLHLDTRDFGIATIQDAVQFVHKVIWPSGAALRYDLAPPTQCARLERG